MNGMSHVLFLLLTTEQRAVGLHEFARQQETIDNGDAVGNDQIPGFGLWLLSFFFILRLLHN